MCLEISNNVLLVLQDAAKLFFSLYKLAIFWSAKKRRKGTFFFSILHPLTTVIFATATVLAFVLLPDSRFNFHCYTHRKATPTQKSAWKCTATSRDFLCERLQSAFTLANQLRRITQYSAAVYQSQGNSDMLCFGTKRNSCNLTRIKCEKY